MKRGILAVVFTLITLLSLFGYVYSIVTSSPLGQFNVTIQNDINVIQLVLNYTNSYSGNITLSANASYGSLTLEFLNSSSDSSLTENYTQGNILSACQNIYIILRNDTGNYISELSNLTPSVSRNFTLFMQLPRLSCLPGAYVTTKFTVRNKTQTSETANITVRLDIPISSSNTLNNYTGIATFNGQLKANATTYQSFFFNATTGTSGEVANITGFTVNMTVSSDADLFLLNNASVLKAKSINRSTNSEWLIFSKNDELMAAPNMWEIRIYGNNTTSAITYSGNLIFTTLNITNINGQTPTNLNFGTMNASTNTSINLTLSNYGNITLSNITETKVVYYIKIFGNNSNIDTFLTRNYSLLLPDSSVINKVKATLNWTGDANYTLNVYFPNGSLAGSSNNKSQLANISGVMQEEYVEALSIPSTAGIWNFEISNNTVAVNPFNITIYAYYPASSWIATNISSTTITLNRLSTVTNTSFSVIGNFTVPSAAISGAHEGYIQYLDYRNAGVRIPFTVTVQTPMLVVNDTMSSMTYQRDENYGFGFTIYNITFNISNPGDYDLGIKWTSSDNMTCDSGCGYYANFYFNNTTKVLPARSSMLLITNITVNNSLPAETAYSGWIRINGTNETDANLTAHPYSEFLLTIRLNMTKYMKLIVTDIKSMDGADNIALNNSDLTIGENVTIKFNVQTINGTNNITSLTLDNITSVWLGEGNVTTSAGRLYLSNGSTYFIGSNPLYYNNYYNLNVTIPAYQPGGRYIPFINMVHYPNSSVTYNATTYAGNNVIVVNNTGLFMSTNISDSDSNCYFGSDCANPTISVNNGSVTSLYVNVSNHGPVRNATATLITYYSCTGWTITNTTPDYYGCIGTSNRPNASAYSTNCVVRYNVTSPAASSTCAVYLLGSPTYGWFNPLGVNITFSSTASTTTTTTSTSGSSSSSSSTSSAAASYLDITSYPSLVIVTQGSTNSTLVKVKNINTTYTQLIKLTVDNLDSSWFSVNPSTSQSTAALATVNFTVTFSPAADAAIKDYTPSFKAVSDYSSANKSFTLRVMPTETTKAQINVSLDQFKANVTALEAELNGLKTLYNVSAAETKLNQLKAKISEAEAFIKAGDYNSAYGLFDAIKSLINDVKTEMDNAKKQGLFTPSNLVTYALIGGGIVVAVVLAYLFWPTRLPTPGRAAVTERAGFAFGRTKEVGSSLAEKLKEALGKIKEKLSRRKASTELKP